MAAATKPKPTKVMKQQSKLKRKRDDVDVEKLEQAVAEFDARASVTRFSDLPLSEPTKSGLQACHFTALTDIQAKAIPLALKGSDILGAAKTGSGKSLAFLIPVLENLYRRQCVGADAGLGAMIISPTRELAIQIFDVLVKIGRKGHLFAAGLVIGGKSLREEQDALSRMNIVVCTPGRILQHLSQTVAFSVDNLAMLVLDEADRIMDMGFQRDVDAIVDYLPKDRQTLLFSATQTKKVSDLARLSLRDPEFVSVHQTAQSSTPRTLQQNYVVTPLPEKLDTLWSFIQSTKKAKILVFLSSGKQVRFVYESFRHLQPGVPLLHLHGRQKQTARLDIVNRFSAAKISCLFATDVVARGLDFPAVDWVVQVDCPEDADTYIHRVGRTARYERDGRAVLFLEPSEEMGMLSRLEQRKVPIERINVRQKKQTSIKNQLQNMCFKDPEVKYLGQKAFVSYVRSVYIQKDKEIFKVQELPLEEFAASLGIPGAPRIKFLKGDDAKERKNRSRQAMVSSESEDEGEAEDGKVKKKAGVRTKYDRMFERRNQDILAEHYAKLIDKGEGAADGEEDDFMAVKRRIPAEGDLDGASIPSAGGSNLTTSPDARREDKKVVSIDGAVEPLVIDSARRAKLIQSKKKLAKLKAKGTKMVYDDEGNAHPVYELGTEEGFKQAGGANDQRQKFVEQEREELKKADVLDKEATRLKRKEKREKRKARERATEMGDEDGEDEDEGVQLAPYDEEEQALEAEVEQRPTRKEKKWFEDTSDGEDDERHKKRRKAVEEQEPETLEDFEALATGLLG